MSFSNFFNVLPAVNCTSAIDAIFLGVNVSIALLFSCSSQLKIFLTKLTAFLGFSFSEKFLLC